MNGVLGHFFVLSNRFETTYSCARTRVDVRQVPGTEGLPGYSVFIT